jgi:hypothetical protein
VFDGEVHRPALATVWIGPADEWTTDPRSSDTDDEWGAQLLEDGRIAAFGIQWHGYEPRNPPSNQFDQVQAGDAEALKTIRTHVINALESVPFLTYIDVRLGGNGECQFRLDVDHTQMKNPRTEPPYLITITQGEREVW